MSKIDFEKPVETVEGLPVRIYAMDGIGPFPVHGAVLRDREWYGHCWGTRGNWSTGPSANDLRNVDPYAELKAAHAAGKVIEVWTLGAWYETCPPLELLTPECYRVKPWTLPAPPEGRQWHCGVWNEEMLPEGYRPLMGGEVIWPEDEVLRNGRVWGNVDISVGHQAHAGHLQTRTKRPLPEPEPKHSPLPWSLGKKGGSHQFIDSGNDPWYQMASFVVKVDGDTDPVGEANAAFAVHACNSHYQLIEALENVLQSAHPSKRDNPAMFGAWESAQATLKEIKP